MARFLLMTAVGSAANEAGLMHGGSGVILILGMIVMSVSIMSLIIFGCADCADNPQKNGGRDRHGRSRYNGGVFYGGAAAFDAGVGGAHGSGGCACGGSGGGGCGGGC